MSMACNRHRENMIPRWNPWYETCFFMSCQNSDEHLGYVRTQTITSTLNKRRFPLNTIYHCMKPRRPPVLSDSCMWTELDADCANDISRDEEPGFCYIPVEDPLSTGTCSSQPLFSFARS